MFQRPIPGFTPSPEAYAESLRPLQVLTDAVADCMTAGALAPADPRYVAGALWAASHGAVSLEIAGYEGTINAQERYADLGSAVVSWFAATPNANPPGR
jgi:hypothetical protein